MKRTASCFAVHAGSLAVLGLLWLLSGAIPAHARITSITYTMTQAYGGMPFGSVGPYQFVTGVAKGAVDPTDPRNAIIQDIELAPLDSNGLVEYSTKFQVLMPVDESQGNHIMLSEVVNRDQSARRRLPGESRADLGLHRLAGGSCRTRKQSGSDHHVGADCPFSRREDDYRCGAIGMDSKHTDGSPGHPKYTRRVKLEHPRLC